MSRPLSGLAAALLMASASGAAIAQDLNWRVSETAGPVTIRHGAEQRPAQRGAPLAAGDSVTTGRDGRAVLVHDRDFVTVAPNSRVAVPEAAQASGLTRLIQTLGNAVYKIEKLGVPHFGVGTPYLAAVVKGTTFSVTVDGTGTSLQVTEGAVEVATVDGGARDLIRPGAMARVEAADLGRLRVRGDEERLIDSPGRRPGAAPSPAAPPPPAPADTPAATPMPEAAVPPANGLDDRVAGSAEVLVSAPVVPETISAKPTDLAAVTGGLVTGSLAGKAAAAERSTVAAETRVAAAEPVPVPVPVPLNATTAPADTRPEAGPEASMAAAPTAPPSPPSPSPAASIPPSGGASDSAAAPAADKSGGDKAGAGAEGSAKSGGDSVAADPAKDSAGNDAAADKDKGKDDGQKAGGGSGKDSPADKNNGKGNEDKPGKDKPGKDGSDDKPGKDKSDDGKGGGKGDGKGKKGGKDD